MFQHEHVDTLYTHSVATLLSVFLLTMTSILQLKDDPLQE